MGGVPVRRFRPRQAGQGCIVYVHGGGFCLGSVASHHGVTADLAARLEREVISVDYRLMPEACYQQGLVDCRDVIEAADPAALVGDSAGGRLLIDAAREMVSPFCLGLIYPYLGFSNREPLGDDAPLLSRADVVALSHMLASDDPPANEVKPPSAGIEVLAVERDPLTSVIESAVSRWRGAGHSVGYRCAPGMVHGALHAHQSLPAMRDAWRAFCAALDRQLGTSDCGI